MTSANSKRKSASRSIFIEDAKFFIKFHNLLELNCSKFEIKAAKLQLQLIGSDSINLQLSII